MTVIDEAAAILGGRAERDVPLGPLTTYRVGGPAALLVRVESTALTWSSSTVPLAAHGPARADRRPGLEPAGGRRWFRGLGRRPRAFRAVGRHRRRHGDRRQRAVSLPVLARQTVAAGLTGFEWAVGVPGSVGGGVRMNAGGHGSDMATVVGRGPRVRPAQRRGWCVPTSALGLRFRGSDLDRPPGRGVGALRARRTAIGPRRRPSWPRSCAGGASTSRGARTPDRSSSTRSPGSCPPVRSSTPWAARPAHRHGRGVARSTPTSSRPTRAAAPTTCAPSWPRFEPGCSSAQGHRAAQRDPPDRLRRAPRRGVSRPRGARMKLLGAQAGQGAGRGHRSPGRGVHRRRVTPRRPRSTVPDPTPASGG